MLAVMMVLFVHRPSERSGEDVDIILTRLREVKAFHRFPPPLLLQICACAFYECLEKGITCTYMYTHRHTNVTVVVLCTTIDASNAVRLRLSIVKHHYTECTVYVVIWQSCCRRSLCCLKCKVLGSFQFMCTHVSTHKLCRPFFEHIRRIWMLAHLIIIALEKPLYC